MTFFESKDNWENFKIENNLTNKDIQSLLGMSSQKYVVSVSVVILLSLLYGIISLIAIVGNSLVIFVVLTRNSMQTVTNIFIANLAFADIFLGVFVIPFQFQTAVLQYWVVPGFICKVAPFVKNMSVTVSVLSLTLISIDRYIAVLNPLKAGFHHVVACILIVIIWLIGIGSSIPEALYFQVNTVFDLKSLDEKIICRVFWPSEVFRKWYSTFILLGQYALPLTIITLSYMRITYRICVPIQPGEQQSLRKESLRNRNRRKIVKMLIVVVSLFGICWLPLQIYNILVPFYKEKVTSFKHIHIIWLAINWLAMSNACYNPFIYGLLNEKFKKEFQNMFKCCVCCNTPRANNYSETRDNFNVNHWRNTRNSSMPQTQTYNLHEIRNQ